MSRRDAVEQHGHEHKKPEKADGDGAFFHFSLQSYNLLWVKVKKYAKFRDNQHKYGFYQCGKECVFLRCFGIDYYHNFAFLNKAPCSSAKKLFKAI